MVAVVLGAALAAGVRAQSGAQASDVVVTGEVQTPGRALPARQLSLSAAVAGAGGFTAGAAVIEIRHRTAGAGQVIATTPATDYRAQYVLRGDLASRPEKDLALAPGDFVIVRKALESHPPVPAGQFGAGAYRLDFTTWGVAAPVVLTSSEPQYTRAAMVAKLQGTVQLEVVVKADGTVGDARVRQGLDAQLPAILAELRRINDAHAVSVLQIIGDGPLGLDANAVECVKTWTFTPGTVLGNPTPIVRDVAVAFKLR